MSILRSIYGLNNVRTANNGSWIIEQAEDAGMRYTANHLPDNWVHVIVETTDKFPKLIADYEVKAGYCISRICEVSSI